VKTKNGMGATAGVTVVDHGIFVWDEMGIHAASEAAK
jgi:hypothetical protein